MGEQTIASRRVYDGALISLRVDEVRLTGGRVTSREVVEHPGAVGVLAWDGARLAMVRQWRQAAGGDIHRSRQADREHVGPRDGRNSTAIGAGR